MSDASTLTEIIEEYGRQGFSGEFDVIDDPVVHCQACGADNDPAEMGVEDRRRV